MTEQTMTVVVVAKRLEADAIFSLELQRPDGQELPPFDPGAHIDVHVPGGLIRQYSLCNRPDERHRYVIGVLRDPASRGGSAALTKVDVGETLEISEPRNHFALVPARHTLLLAGGIGVTPILCMAEKLSSAKADFELHYCSRTPKSMAFVDRIRASTFADRSHFHFDDGGREQLLSPDAIIGDPVSDRHLYVCGPTGFMDWIIDRAREAGWAEDNIHREYFAAAEIDTTGDKAFDVKISSTGAVLTIPADRRVIDVLAENGFELPVSCEEGVCGTCLTRVLEGEIEHRDMFLTDADKAKGDRFMPCVSRACGKLLVLDL